MLTAISLIIIIKEKMIIVIIYENGVKNRDYNYKIEFSCFENDRNRTMLCTNN